MPFWLAPATGRGFDAPEQCVCSAANLSGRRRKVTWFLKARAKGAALAHRKKTLRPFAA